MNMLGIREPEMYGTKTYQDLIDYIDTERGDKNDIYYFQSNHEGEIIDAIQQAYYDKIDGIVINPAAYTHTSIAIADALRSVAIPYVEVHLSDPNSREDYRKISYVRDAAKATITGKGFEGYIEAIDLVCR